MNRSEWLSDELLEDAFEHRAGRGSLDSLRADVLSATAAAGQRRVWRLRLANLLPGPMSRPSLAILLLAALLAAVLVIALAGRQPPNPFNLGTLAFIRGGDVYLADPDGSNARVVVHENGVVFWTVSWSRDGRHVAVDGESGVVVLDVASGATSFVGGNNPRWSPDGRQLAVIVASQGPTSPTLRIVDPDSGALHAEFPFAAIGGLAWSPDGRWIAATGDCTGPLCPEGETSAANAVIRIDVETGDVIQVDGRSGHLDAERQVAWSPDSLRIAYIRWGMDATPGYGCSDALSCTRDVIVADADGSNDVRVNQEHGRADQPSWSPDGQWIAFRDSDHITIEHPDGTAGRSILDRPVLGFIWGPASDRVWFTLQDAPGGMATVWEALLSGGVHPLGVSIDDGSTRFGGTGLGFGFQVRAAGQPAPSLPSGVSNTPAPTLDAVTPPPAAAADPSGTWSRLLTESSDGCELLSIATGSGTATQIADLCNPPATDGSSGSWSPTGTAYAIVRDGRLSIIHPDGRVDLLVDDLVGLNGVAWSPDGTWLSATGTSTYLLRPDGSGLREMPGTVTWSPDSQRLALVGTDQKLLMGPASGVGMIPIGTFPLPTTWSPDGSRFGFLRNGNVWSASIDGTDVRNVTSLPLGGASGATWSPDGHWVAVTANHGLWLVRPDGSERHWLDVGNSQSTYDAVWSPDSLRLAISTYEDSAASSQRARTYIVHPDGSPTLRIDETWSPSWSPDGRFLVATDVPDADPSSQGSLVLMNADGSGRRILQVKGSGSRPVWLR